jgi:3-oxoacyl-[acyl-carrier protein] reductase
MLPFMIRQKKGNILNISSLAGVRILAAPVHYCATKAGVKGFSESLSKELGRYNVQVNCLAPGILDGGVATGIPENKLNKFIKQVSLGRIGTFDEVAECATFLISDQNSYMSGHTIIMDGGL